MSAADAAALLPALARQALANEAVLLSAPEWPRVPDCLRRASGESVYVPHGASRYATQRQLALEDRLLADAGEAGAPRLEPAAAARLLGAKRAHLQAQLQAQAADRRLSEVTGSGLRLDQAAAAFAVLTSARRVEVMAGPAGSGKTRTVAQMARAWQEAGLGEVIGLATSQTAANVLAEAGVTRAYNTAQFLGHLPGQREARGAAAARDRVAADRGRGEHDVGGRPGRDRGPGPRAATARSWCAATTSSCPPWRAAAA